MNSGIYRSFDDGDNFEKVLDGHIGFGLKFRPDSAIYFYGSEYFIISEDNGDTWDTLCTFEGYGYFYFKNIDFGLNGEIYAVGGTYTPWGGGFYRSFDYGITWENTGITDDHLQSICVNQYGNIIVGGFSGFHNYHSNDAGDTWINGTEMYADVMKSFDNDKLIVGGYINFNTGCWFSENWGEVWIDISEGLSYPAVKDISIAPDNSVYIVTEYNTYDLYRTINPIVSVQPKKTEPQINFYPNPAIDYLIISGVQAEDIRFLKIYNSNGQLIKKETQVNDRIDMSQLEKGIYLIYVLVDNDHHQKKIVKN
jgi:hypothetical protein